MKKLFVIFTISFNALLLNGNPMYDYKVCIAKLSFDDNEEWRITLVNTITLDSLFISSSTGSSICTKVPESFSYGFDIRNDSLNSEVFINPDGDSLSINAYYTYQDQTYFIKNSLVYGNFKNSIVPKPLKGQSIVRIFADIAETNYYCISDSLGHLKGKLYGHIYDKNNNLITKGSFVLSPYPGAYTTCDYLHYGDDGFDINDDSTYSASLYSVKYYLNRIGIGKKDSCKYGIYYNKIDTKDIDPLNLTMEPDSSIALDIHLLDTLVHIKKVEAKPNELLKVFPNPLNDTYFKYRIVTPVKSSNCFIDLLNINGQKLKSYKILENSGELQLPLNIPYGEYLFQLRMNEKVYISTQIIVERK